MKKELTYCDVCKEETKITEERLQVIFTTEQTEGRSTKPYLSYDGIDICSACMAHILKGEALWAHGAQGHNTYYFDKDKK